MINYLLLCFIFNNLNYTVMSQSASKAFGNRDQVGENETLFDFLKRKKKYNLENTVNKSLYQHSYTKKKIDLDLEEEYPQLKEDKTRYTANQYHSNNDAQRNTRVTITPKKIDFEEPKKNKVILKQQEQKLQKPSVSQGKSFLAMISPIKNRTTSALQERVDDRENIVRSNKKSVKGGIDSFSKKGVTKCINSIKETINTLSSSIKALKEKSHGLVVQFNPLFNIVAESGASYAKQVGEFKNKLKSFECIIETADNENIDAVVETFHKTLEQHIQSEEGYLRKTFEKSKNEQIQSIKEEKDRIIQTLQSQNKKLNKQIQLLERRLDKVQSNNGNLQQAVSQRQFNYVQQIQRIKITSQNTIQQLKAKVEQLYSKCEQLTDKNKYLEKQIKNERNLKQGVQNRYREQIQKIVQAKDAYLLNEIMVLKTEFNVDLSRVNQLHRLKEAQLIARLQKKEEEINKKTFERGCDKQIQTKIIQQANILKQENLQLKSKTECIITDMYRMNEELYQHWIALKDIKALSQRLGAFAQYRKIYEDLAFNDQLFH